VRTNDSELNGRKQAVNFFVIVIFRVYHGYKIQK